MVVNMRSPAALRSAEPATSPARPHSHLRLVPPPAPEPRLAPAQRVAALGLGLVLGFLLVALVSAPLGLGAAAGDLRLAAVAAVLSAPALVRSRALARRARRDLVGSSSRMSTARRQG
jgi:hypothetical protein